jgi:hypothetical protein
MTGEIDVKQWLAISKEAGLQLEQNDSASCAGRKLTRLAEGGEIIASIDG